MLPAFGEHLKATQTEEHRTTDEEHRHYLLVVVEEGGSVARNCCNGGNSCQGGSALTVQLFNFKSHQIRVVEINGDPWLVAKDVLEALGMDSNQPQNYLRHLGDGEITRSKVTGFRGVGVNLLSESGLYKLVMRSDKPTVARCPSSSTPGAASRQPQPNSGNSGVKSERHCWWVGGRTRATTASLSG
ncbi:BRO family protein [Thauera propionica]